MGQQFIDFKWVVENADVEAVLSGLDCEVVQRSGDEIRLHCPLHEDENPSCSINTVSKKWKCFAGCGDGDILELVALALDTDKRSACQSIAEWSGITLADPDKRGKRNSAPRGRGRVKPAIKGQKPPAPPPEETPQKEWQPYTTRLKLDSEHAYGVERFTPEAIATFDMGYQDRGLLKNRWCMPVHDAIGGQLGYIGRHAGKTTPRKEPRWLFPEGFPKSSVLFNLHRVLGADPADLYDGALIVVEGCGDAIRLHELGLPVVSCLGTHISEAQGWLIEEHDFTQVLLVFDGDAEGQKAVPDAVAALSRHVFVRTCKLPDGHDPETVPPEFFAEHLWWL